MKESDIILTPITQADGNYKNRPALILKIMPKYNDFLQQNQISLPEINSQLLFAN